MDKVRGFALSRYLVLLVALAAITLAGCSGVSDSDSASNSTSDSEFSRLVAVGADEVFVQCRGRGEPPVVLISGAGVSATSWGYIGNTDDRANPPEVSSQSVESRVSTHTQVCSYDRPGTVGFDQSPSRSTPIDQPTTAQGNAEILHSTLVAAGIGGPYILVGHSWGGFIATTFSRMYPDDVAGMVLIDPGSQYLKSVLPTKVWSNWMDSIVENRAKQPNIEQPDYPASIQYLETLSPAPQVPTVVLTSDQPLDFLGTGEAKKYHPQWVEAQSLLAQSLGAQQITKTKSGHFIQTSNAQLVSEEVERVLAQVRQQRD